MNSLANEKANGNVFYSPINSVSITDNVCDYNQRDAGGNLKNSRTNTCQSVDYDL